MSTDPLKLPYRLPNESRLILIVDVYLQKEVVDLFASIIGGCRMLKDKSKERGMWNIERK